MELTLENIRDITFAIFRYNNAFEILSDVASDESFEFLEEQW